MWANKYSIKDVYVGRGDYDADLLSTINTFCVENDIKVGIVQAIGAVQNIKLGYYDQNTKKYVQSMELEHKAPFEIASLTGNVSLKEDKPFCHLHITVSDREGSCYGGHLLEGVKIFALEFCILSLNGELLKRDTDPITLLPLWMK